MKLKLRTGIILERQEAIDALRELLKIAELANKHVDPNFSSWPDMHVLIDYLEVKGLPPKGS